MRGRHDTVSRAQIYRTFGRCHAPSAHLKPLLTFAAGLPTLVLSTPAPSHPATYSPSNGVNAVSSRLRWQGPFRLFTGFPKTTKSII